MMTAGLMRADCWPNRWLLLPGRVPRDSTTRRNSTRLDGSGDFGETIVIFSADHGSSILAPGAANRAQRGAAAWAAAGSARLAALTGAIKAAASGGKKGGSNKGTLSDSGVRVPFVMRVPSALAVRLALRPAAARRGGLNGTVVVRAAVDAADVLPTLLALCGVRPPARAEVALDGISLVPLIVGDAEAETSEATADAAAEASEAALAARTRVAYAQFGWRSPDVEQPAPDGGVAMRRARLVRDARWLLKQPALGPEQRLLFDLRDDPEMLVPLDPADEPRVARRARARLLAALESVPPDARRPFDGYLDVEVKR